MLHWTPSPAAGPIVGSALGPARATRASSRSDHARMLGHAAKRRLLARGEDAGYWKACAPAALARAASIRAQGLSRLP